MAKGPKRLQRHQFKAGTKHGKAHPNAKKKGTLPAGLKKFLLQKKK